jgi:hypothetical protein
MSERPTPSRFSGRYATKPKTFMINLISENGEYTSSKTITANTESTVEEVMETAGITPLSNYYISIHTTPVFISNITSKFIAAETKYYVQGKLNAGARSIRTQVQDESGQVELYIVLPLDNKEKLAKITIKDIFFKLSEVQPQNLGIPPDPGNYTCKMQKILKYEEDDIDIDDDPPIVCSFNKCG